MGTLTRGFSSLTKTMFAPTVLKRQTTCTTNTLPLSLVLYIYLCSSLSLPSSICLSSSLSPSSCPPTLFLFFILYHYLSLFSLSLSIFISLYFLLPLSPSLSHALFSPTISLFLPLFSPTLPLSISLFSPTISLSLSLSSIAACPTKIKVSTQTIRFVHFLEVTTNIRPAAETHTHSLSLSLSLSLSPTHKHTHYPLLLSQTHTHTHTNLI